MARSARSWRIEADQLRAEGSSYSDIVRQWVVAHGFHPLVAARLAHGLTQAEVAARWNKTWPHPTPRTAKNLSYWETGRAASLDTLNKLAFLYKCRAGDLLGGEDYSHLDEANAAETRTNGGHAPGAQVQLLTAAVAVVLRDDEILLVCRRGSSGIRWQFPAGVVKPGADPADVAISETLNETGIRCAVEQPLGSRLHPVTGAWLEYFLCSYLAGEPTNRDPAENLDVTWAPVAKLLDFIPEQHIFKPVLDHLQGAQSA